MPSDQSPLEPTNPEPQVPPANSEPAIESLPIIEPGEPPPTSRVRPKPTLPPDFVDETLPETAVRLIKQALRDAQPRVKRAAVQVLKSTIGLLESTIERLEAEPQPPSLTRDPIAPSPTIATPTIAPTEALEPSSTPSASPSAPTTQTLQARWGGLLQWVRSRLPDSLNQKLDDQALTGAIAGLLVVVLWTGSAVLPGKSKPPEVAIAPPTAPAPQPVPPQVKAPASPQPVPVSPTPKPKPSPTPALQLSPEQKLIASIQDQVAEVSDRYSSSLIQSVQANFRSSRLVVKLGESWYGLSETQQNKLSNELLKRAQQLDFVKLELSDPQGVLLARSPVVGAEMIILKRSTDAVPEPEKTA